MVDITKRRMKLPLPMLTQNELVEAIVVGMKVERCCDIAGEAFLGDVVPVDLLYRASRRTDG